MTQYDFCEQLEKSKISEDWIDGVLKSRFRVEPVSLRDEKENGIDRRLTCLVSEMAFTAEYKFDYLSATTGNAFIELWSDWEKRTPGWARTTKADLLIHAIPCIFEIRFLRPLVIRELLPFWIMKYRPLKDVDNKGWTTRGVCVPLSVIDAACVLSRRRRVEVDGGQAWVDF